jgi:hypothetical protein
LNWRLNYGSLSGCVFCCVSNFLGCQSDLLAGSYNHRSRSGPFRPPTVVRAAPIPFLSPAHCRPRCPHSPVSGVELASELW